MSFYDPLSPNDDQMEIKKPQSNNAWMLTVADLFSLMLTFFVLLYSMSVIQFDEWEQVASSLQQRLEIPDQIDRLSTPDIVTIPRERIVWARGLDYLSTVIEKQLGTDEEQFKGLQLIRLPDRIILSLSSDEAFAAGNATLQGNNTYRVMQLGHFLSTLGNAITIEGHTDPSPINTNRFPSNWELSMARAIAVANTLYESGYPHKLNVVGLGSSRFNQPVEGADPKNADQKFRAARRVDIVIRETVAK